MSIQKVAIIGAGRMAREVLDVFDAVNADEPSFDVIGYIVESDFGEPGARVNDLPILGDFACLQERQDEILVVCGVGSPAVRRRLIERAGQIGVRFCSVVHPTVITTRWVTVGKGSVICAGAILTNQIVVGDHVIINVGSTVSHDAVLENFATLAPATHIAGNVRCEEGCNIGIGANVAPGTRVGAWSIVGAGATVVDDVPTNTTVVGTPARVIARRESGWHLA